MAGMRIAIALPLLFLAPALSGCNAAPEGLAWNTLDQGNDSAYSGGGAGPWYVFLHDNPSWTAFWAKHRGNHVPVPEAMQVDFAKDVAIAVVLGTRGNGGYSIEVKQLEFTIGNYHVEATETQPGSNCFTSKAITNPYHIIILPRVDGVGSTTTVDGHIAIKIEQC